MTDGVHVCTGSFDGSLFLWNINVCRRGRGGERERERERNGRGRGRETNTRMVARCMKGVKRGRERYRAGSCFEDGSHGGDSSGEVKRAERASHAYSLISLFKIIDIEQTTYLNP